MPFLAYRVSPARVAFGVYNPESVHRTKTPHTQEYDIKLPELASTPPGVYNRFWPQLCYAPACKPIRSRGANTTGERHRGAESAQQTLEPDPVSTGVGSRIFSVPSPMQRARTFPFQRRKEKPHVTHHRAQASGPPQQPKLAS